jgi:acyl-CoA hydrolase
MKTKTPDDSETIMTEIIFPNDTNPMGIVQGGRVVQLMDIACAVCAQVHSGGIAVTASINNVHFIQPAMLGDVLTIKARITRVFNTSMEIYAEVITKRLPDMKPTLTNYAYFTFVALDQNKKPVKVAPITPANNEDRSRYKDALKRKNRSNNRTKTSIAA